MGFGELSRLVNRWRFEGSGSLGEGIETLCVISILMHLFHLAIPKLHPFIINLEI